MFSLKNKQIYLITFSFICFLLISVLSSLNKLSYLDYSVIAWFNNQSSASVQTFMKYFTTIGSGEVILITTLALTFYLLYKKLWAHILFLFTLTFGGIGLNLFLKILFQRERPGEMSVIEVFGFSLEIASYSFPSGHTMRSVLLFSFLVYLAYHFIKRRSLKITLIFSLTLLIATIALSRIIVGAHFPSDILAAITISITWFFLSLNTLKYYLTERFRINLI
ncbi:phosphatase PAP2 family protein [Halalkalibacter akibai]|uniref:Phosphatidic acid phosphatase type 2/haloperoxidase domain-containing protein n=1 Tax=Halalkalibacter akibai (strain ATCC 43226 / DSM 21942 / CIP 109018 / JCM 9157 / 1139) TaxID=1236973 RepID=W4QXH3_HALA3|nr:phosphatase PAP2 family protein [Halalkalibacter akibai]GAE36796.1 hypothetical protein JCM9157_4015 [Halalkalibacter akibai JCM 9157]